MAYYREITLSQSVEEKFWGSRTKRVVVGVWVFRKIPNEESLFLSKIVDGSNGVSQSHGSTNFDMATDYSQVLLKRSSPVPKICLVFGENNRETSFKQGRKSCRIVFKSQNMSLLICLRKTKM